MRPVRAKALIINAFALTGRFAIFNPYTQGAALGYVLLPLRGVLLRLLTHTLLYNQPLFGNKSYWHGTVSFRVISRRTRHKSVV